MDVLKFSANYDVKNRFCLDVVTQKHICTVWLMFFSPYSQFTLLGIKGDQNAPCLPNGSIMSELVTHFLKHGNKFLVTEWGGDLWFALPNICPVSSETVLLRIDPEIDRKSLLGHLVRAVPEEFYSISKSVDVKNVPTSPDESADDRILSFLKYLSYIMFEIQSFSKVTEKDQELCIINCIKGIMMIAGCAGKVVCKKRIGASYSKTHIRAVYSFLLPMLMTVSTASKYRCADISLSSVDFSAKITLSIAGGNKLDIMDMYADMEDASEKRIYRVRHQMQKAEKPSKYRC